MIVARSVVRVMGELWDVVAFVAGDQTLVVPRLEAAMPGVRVDFRMGETNGGQPRAGHAWVASLGGEFWEAVKQAGVPHERTPRLGEVIVQAVKKDPRVAENFRQCLGKKVPRSRFRTRHYDPFADPPVNSSTTSSDPRRGPRFSSFADFVRAFNAANAGWPEGVEWGVGGQPRPNKPRPEPSLPDDWGVLGLQPGASRDEIKAAHRVKALEHHPDRGGDAAKQAQVNGARDRLLGIGVGAPRGAVGR